MLKIIPSQQQAAIYDAWNRTKSNIGIEATAGSGKTTTLLELLKFTSTIRKTVFLSFANAIVNELKEKVPPHIKASTLHSLGMGYILRAYGQKILKEDKYFALAMPKLSAGKEGRTSKAFYKKCYQTQDIATYLRITLCELTYSKGEEMCDKYDISFTEETLKVAIECVKNDPLNSIDFTDMIYIPAVRPEIVTIKYDNVFLDEAQDCNQAGIRLVENILNSNTGRLVFCGDSKQCIYSFIGSDLDTFEYLKTRANTVNLPLSTSYRCAKAIVKLAQKVFPKENYIEALETADEGLVRHGDVSEVEPGDMIICRTNKPLFEIYFQLIDRGVKSHFIGKDIEKGIVEIANACMGPTKFHFENNLTKRLLDLEKELAKKGVRNPESHPRWSSLKEKIELLMIVVEKVQTIKDLVPTIHQIFTPDKQGVRLLTGHRSKGLENNRVFLLNKYDGKTLCPSPRAITDREKLAEQNVMFVMITRAKKELIFLSL